MAVINTLAYYVTATITAVKSFIVQAPGVFTPGKNFYPSLKLESKEPFRLRYHKELQLGRILACIQI